VRVDYTHIPRYIQTCDMNCVSAFEPGYLGFRQYCVSICARCTKLAVWIQNPEKTKKRQLVLLAEGGKGYLTENGNLVAYHES